MIYTKSQLEDLGSAAELGKTPNLPPETYISAGVAQHTILELANHWGLKGAPESWVQLADDLAAKMFPDTNCSKCGKTEEENSWGRMIDIRVITSEGEEGFADITMYLCDECFTPIQEGLMALGFKDHRHGSTDFLEDMECPGWGKCPTPTKYGRVHLRYSDAS